MPWFVCQGRCTIMAGKTRKEKNNNISQLPGNQRAINGMNGPHQKGEYQKGEEGEARQPDAENINCATGQQGVTQCKKRSSQSTSGKGPFYEGEIQRGKRILLTKEGPVKLKVRCTKPKGGGPGVRKKRKVGHRNQSS